MKSKRIGLTLLLLVAIVGLTKAEGEHWSWNSHEYPSNSTFVGVITIDGVEQRSSQLEIGAFYDGVCRGSVICIYNASKDRYYAYLTVNGESGMNMTFRLWNHATEEELDVDSRIIYTFLPNDYFGVPSNPYVFPFTSHFGGHVYIGGSSTTWSDPENWLGEEPPTSVNDEVFILNDCILDEDVMVAAMTIIEGKSLTVEPGSTLVVLGDLISTMPSSIVIEDGAQLVHASENVSATVKKNTIGFGTDNGKYCLISNPLVSFVNPNQTSTYHLTGGNYDLYDWFASAPDNLEWRNFKDNDFMISPEGYGYLYANQNGVELTFPGILKPSHNRYAKSVSYDSNDTEHPGWNLIGNPFVCNAKLVDADNEPLPYYRMNAAGNGFEAVAPGTPIAPMEGVFYQAFGNETVYFVRGGLR